MRYRWHQHVMFLDTSITTSFRNTCARTGVTVCHSSRDAVFRSLRSVADENFCEIFGTGLESPSGGSLAGPGSLGLNRPPRGVENGGSGGVDTFFAHLNPHFSANLAPRKSAPRGVPRGGVIFGPKISTPQIFRRRPKIFWNFFRHFFSWFFFTKIFILHKFLGVIKLWGSRVTRYWHNFIPCHRITHHSFIQTCVIHWHVVIRLHA